MKKATRPVQGLGLSYAGGRPREEDVLTRRRLSFWTGPSGSCSSS